MRIITLNQQNEIVGVRDVGEHCVLAENERVSDVGVHGQVLLEDGTFMTPEPTAVEPLPTLQEMQAQTLLNTEYLVIMSELSNL